MIFNVQQNSYHYSYHYFKIINYWKVSEESILTIQISDIFFFYLNPNITKFQNLLNKTTVNRDCVSEK